VTQLDLFDQLDAERAAAYWEPSATSRTEAIAWLKEFRPEVIVRFPF